MIINQLIASSCEVTQICPSTAVKPVASQLTQGRIPKLDMLTPRILSHQAVEVYLTHMGAIQSLFSNIHLTSLQQACNMFTWQEIIDTQMTVNVKSIVSLCMKMDLVPICMSERNLQNHILSTIPPQNQDEYNFFDNDTIITTFQDMKTA